MPYMILNDDQLPCQECHEVHEFLTRTIEDNCGFPALFDEELMKKLKEESEDGTFMGGRPVLVDIITEGKI